MTSVLQHSMFDFVLFPKEVATEISQDEDLVLRRQILYKPLPKSKIASLPIVIFDFETTGLDPVHDRIIEVGAFKTVNGKKTEEFSQLTGTDVVITELITNISGITADMIAGKPHFDEVLADFLQFIRGSLLVAHNADFDWGMLKAACNRCGIDIEWPVFCTVKMSRKVLPELGRYNLDTLAQHYNLKFEERHRAVGDIKVLSNVLANLLEDDPSEPESWEDLKEYRVS